jgi:hypothetical protein
MAAKTGDGVRSVATGTALALSLMGQAALAADVGAAKPAAPPEACKATLSAPVFGPTIPANPNPICFTAPGLGEIYVGGALTAYGYTQTNPFPFFAPPLPTDRRQRFDLSNLQGWVQKADGPVQFFVQAGAYAIPALGLPNFSAFDQTRLLFTPLPVAWGKIVFNDNWSLQAGRLPTLIGSEAPFTFQNINIQRGLLFNQENVINHGVQLNWSDGPWSVSVAATDGFFSRRLTWFTGAVTYKLDDNHSFGVNGGLNLDRTDVLRRSVSYQYRAPLNQQNSAILSVNYTYTNGPLTITPYFQYTNVERDLSIGILQSASTYGGAVLAAYNFTDNFSLGGRVEYITQSGTTGSGTTSLLYGAGSSAFSFTVTPTFKFGPAFLRGEYSHVQLSGTTRGDPLLGTIGTGFGRTGNRTSQDRFMFETGVTF